VWFDDAQSIVLKYRFIKAEKLAGAMIWALGYDSGRTELWQAIQDELGDPVVIPDAGTPVPDAGSPDAGVDAGSADAGVPDAGHVDAGEPDAGSEDAGQPDAGSADAGTIIATDAGTIGTPSDGGTQQSFASTGCSTSPGAPNQALIAGALALLAIATARRRK
jgi:MYXO-CTERM domain-containing protein